MKNKTLEENIKKFILLILLIWFAIPLFKVVKITSDINRYTYIKIAGGIGVLFLTIYISKNLYFRKDKKEFCIEILPIIFFGAYMIWTLISCLVSNDINKAFLGTVSRLDGYITYLAYAGFFSLAFLLNSNKSRKILLNTFVFISVINCLIIELTNHINITEFFELKKIKTGIFSNSNHYGYYLLLVTTCANFLFITEKNKYVRLIYLVSYAILLYYLILNNTFGCYLALIITLLIFLIYSIYNRKKVFLGIISIIIFILMSCCIQKNIVAINIDVMTKDVNKVISTVAINKKETTISEEKKSELKKVGSGRLDLWINGIKFFLEKPILGYGPENLGEKYLELNIKQDRPHNLIIQLATTSGLLGLIFYLTAVRNYYKKKCKDF